MLKGNKKIFLDKELLYKMVNLRLNGWAFTSLATLYGCNRSSISDQCIKYGIVPWTDKIYSIEMIADDYLSYKDKNKTQWKFIDGERVCLGRKYSDYVK